MRAALQKWNGSEVGTQGDAFFIPGGVKHNEIYVSADKEALEVSVPGKIGTVNVERPAGLPDESRFKACAVAFAAQATLPRYLVETPRIVSTMLEQDDWSLLGEVPEGPRIILAGGLDPDNVANAVRKVQPWGVDVSSGVERSPGLKDPMKVKLFIERARAAAPQQHLGPDSMPYDWDDDEE
jgi:hypothetical protein